MGRFLRAENVLLLLVFVPLALALEFIFHAGAVVIFLASGLALLLLPPVLSTWPTDVPDGRRPERNLRDTGGGPGDAKGSRKGRG